MVQLNEVGRDNYVRVSGMEINGSSKRLADRGFLPGVGLYVSKSDWGGMIVKIGGARVGMSRCLANCISVIVD